MSGRLERFLAARELDEAAGLVVEWGELSAAEVAQVRVVLARKDDPVAWRNLLLHPEAIPRESLVSALVAGLRAEDQHAVLAAVVGSHRAGGRLTDTERRTVATEVLELLSAAGPAVIRQRASAALIVLASRDEVEAFIADLADRDPVVRHNVRAVLVRILGANGALAAVTESARAGGVPAESVRFVDEGVDGGTATNHDLITRGVLATQLVPITMLEA